ncbi:hypothetical protein MKW98_004095 [Papaver atlanticum]|uniref:Fe2OG dioxygenase domain-containing protein n=1 Tax=Papaver atlanticum TaxID=357466 RepID=A0AAD4SYL5_9MAGN|nr:hypothetical protein MKW98_004095 [Papaver atlanticum]
MACSSFSSPSSSKVLIGDIIKTTDSVPSNYIRPISERPNLTQVQSSQDSSIPLINLQELDGPNHSNLIQQIGHACQYDGFFQVRNHGVPEVIIEKMLQVGKEFFRLPESERMKCYSTDTSKTIRLSTSFNVTNEKTANWRDYLRLHCYPLEDYIPEWPTNPSSFRSDVPEYCTSIRALTLKLLGAISESLGLKRDYIEMVLSNHGQHMAINYYPPCPEPELTYGLPGHTDPNAITVLLQDDVPGLQVLKDGKWIAVHPIPNTFIINIGDQIQAISNDKYKSVLHRAVVNCDKERFSIPTFCCPSKEAVIRPAFQLVDDEHPSLYKDFTYTEYFGKFWNQKLGTESTLDIFKTTSNSYQNERGTT